MAQWATARHCWSPRWAVTGALCSGVPHRQSITPPKTPCTLLLAVPTAALLYASHHCATPVVASLLPKPEVALMQLLAGQKLFHLPFHPSRLCIAPIWPSTPSFLSLSYYHYLCYRYYWRAYSHAAAALLSGEHGMEWRNPIPSSRSIRAQGRTNTKVDELAIPPGSLTPFL